MSAKRIVNWSGGKVVLSVCLLATVSLAFAVSENPSRTARYRIREGTNLKDQKGYLKVTGDRITFYTCDGNQRFRGLENLALQRIAETIDRSTAPGRLEWTVSGTITEFRGANYLLISRAVLKSKISGAGTERP